MGCKPESINPSLQTRGSAQPPVRLFPYKEPPCHPERSEGPQSEGPQAYT